MEDPVENSVPPSADVLGNHVQWRRGAAFAKGGLSQLYQAHNLMEDSGNGKRYLMKTVS